MARSVNIYVESDNLLKVTGLKNKKTDAFINDAAITAHVTAATALNPTASGVATSENAGAETGIPCVGHGKVVGDKVLIFGTKNHDGVYTLTSNTLADKLVIDNAYVAETFTGNEEIYCIVTGADNITIAYEAASDGDYYGVLSDAALLFAGISYNVFFIIISGTLKAVDKTQYKAIYM